jgi:hypothetical protein
MVRYSTSWSALFAAHPAVGSTTPPAGALPVPGSLPATRRDAAIHRGWAQNRAHFPEVRIHLSGVPPTVRVETCRQRYPAAPSRAQEIAVSREYESKDSHLRVWSFSRLIGRVVGIEFGTPNLQVSQIEVDIEQRLPASRRFQRACRSHKLPTATHSNC